MRVLIVEDEDAIAAPLAEALRREGMSVECAATGREALEAAVTDLVLLDLRLPDLDGCSVLRELRARSSVPIIVVTARGEEVDRVVGLELGADDYVVKPFSVRELVARMRAVTRRGAAPPAEGPLRGGRLEVDPRARRVLVDGRELSLTPKEFDLLALLAREPEAVVTRRRIMETVWDARWFGSTKTLDVHVASLRRKLGDPSWVQTVRSVGFRLGAAVTGRLMASHLALVLLVLAALEIPLGAAYAGGERQALTAKVERDATTFASLAEDAVPGRHPSLRAAFAGAARRYRRAEGGRVLLVDLRGRTIVDSGPANGAPGGPGGRPEILRALDGQVAVGTRWSRTLGHDLLYVAVPVASGGRVSGAVRVTYPTSAAAARVRRDWLLLAAVGVVVLALAALVSWRFSSTLTGPLRRLRATARAVGEGDRTARAATDRGPAEVRALAAVMNETVERLDALVRSQGEFVADASHELRTPLTALRLRLENLEDGVRPAARAGLRAAQAEAERLSRLVDALLALARADRDATGDQSGDVGALIGQCADRWAPLAAERGVELIPRAEPALVAAMAPEALGQVLDNLVANAVQASPPGGVVRVSAGTVGGRVVLRVADQGRGMSPSERARAFDRFWRGSGKGPGSGLGLAIVHRLVAGAGGEVSLDPSPAGGLEAVVLLDPGHRLPARRSSAQDAGVPQ